MSLPVSCPPAESGGTGGTPSPVGGYSSSEASSGGPFCSEAGSAPSGGSFSNGNYAAYDPAGYPVTSSSSSSSLSSAAAQLHDRNHNHQLMTPRVPGKCGRPGCPNPVNTAADGTESTYCSSECVVGQCREVYTSWATTGGSAILPPAAGGLPLAGQGNPHNKHQHLLTTVQTQQQQPLPPPPQVK